MGAVYIKADGSAEDVDAAFQKFQDEFGGKA